MIKILRGVLLGILLTVLVAVPVLAAYYAYLTVEESNGNAYDELPVICSRNITQLVDYGVITASGLDTRVLTGSGTPLPHMLANDKILFTTDLGAHDERTLVFYCGATSLSSFPIVVGYNGSFETPDDPDLELGYVMELLISGYFNAEAADVGHNILYKEDAFRVWISAADTIRVAALNATGDEQWEMHWNGFTTGEHIVYILANGIAAYLYVDDFVTAKDTVNLFSTANWQLSNTKDHWMATDGSYYYPGGYPRTFYAQGMYWAFYNKDGDYSNIYYKTSADGDSWSGEYTLAAGAGNATYMWSVWLDDSDYVHISYPDYHAAGSNYVIYRRGLTQANSTITWDTDWQVVLGYTPPRVLTRSMVVADPSGYPTIMFYMTLSAADRYTYIAKSTTNNGTFTYVGVSKTIITANNHHRNWLVQYPNSDKMYVLYNGVSGANFVNIKGCYFNGAAWAGSDDTIYSGTLGQAYHGVRGVADNDDNLYVAYSLGAGVGGWYLKIRYSDGSWSSPILISNSATSLDMSYNAARDFVYIFLVDSGDVYAMALNIDESILVAPCFLFTAPDGHTGIASTPYTEHIGMLYSTITPAVASETGHAYLQFPWEWNDNANNWTWIQNNVMPYVDDIRMAVDGTLQLEYAPDSIIQGTTLPDEENDNDAVITWGSNPAGVSASLSVLHPDPAEGAPPVVVPPGGAAGPDVVGPTGQPGWTSGLPVLASNPLYPLVAVISSETSIPVGLVWIIGATFLLILAMVMCFKYVPHQIITVLVGGGLCAFFYHMGIYPFWVIFIFAAMGIAVIIGERTPTV